MKNKKLIYLLLPLVLGLWGYIFYRIFFANSIDQVNINPQGNHELKKKTEIISYDSVFLSLNYDDPFFKKFTSKPLSNQNPTLSAPKKNRDGLINQTRKNTIKNNEVKLEWPDIKYFGLITQENKSLGLIKYKNKTMYISKGDHFEDINILNITNDSILINYKNKKKYFKR